MAIRLPQRIPPVGLESAHRETQTVATLVHRLTHELATLVRQQLALAGARFTHLLGKVLAAATAVVAGGAVLLAGLLVLLAAAVLGLSHIMTAWAAALLVGIVVSIVGIATVVAGARALIHTTRTGLSPRSWSENNALTRKTS